MSSQHAAFSAPQRMQIPNLKSVPLAALAALAAASACASLGTPEDQSTAASLWKEIDGHGSWNSFAGHVGIQEGHSPHGKFVRTTINSIAADAPDVLPDGSIVVKENFKKNDPATLDSYTVMKRVEGYDPENGDWFWARFDSKGGLTHSGKVSMCIDCHFDADGDDFVFLND